MKFYELLNKYKKRDIISKMLQLGININEMSNLIRNLKRVKPSNVTMGVIEVSCWFERTNIKRMVKLTSFKEDVKSSFTLSDILSCKIKGQTVFHALCDILNFIRNENIVNMTSISHFENRYVLFKTLFKNENLYEEIEDLSDSREIRRLNKNMKSLKFKILSFDHVISPSVKPYEITYQM